MPVKISCPKCQTPYQVPDSAVGKSVKCKKCNSAFKVNAPSQKQAAQKAAQKAAKRPVAAAPAQNLQQFGLDGLKKQPDIFSSPPPGPQSQLGNYADDPGFADIRDIQAEDDSDEFDDDGMSDIVNNPYADTATSRIKKKAGKTRSRKSKKNKKAKLTKQPWFLILAIFIPFFMVSATIGIFLPTVGHIITVVGLSLLGIINLVVSLWYLKCVFDCGEGAEIIMFFLIPFYALFFLVIHWNEMKGVFFATLSITAGFIIGLVAMMI